MEIRKASKTGPGKDTLLTLLDNNRAVLLWKVDGLSVEEVSRPVVASGTSLLGLVKHLAYVERWWFDDFFAGNTVDYPWSEEDPDADFRIEDGETIDDIVSLYTAAVARSNELVSVAYFV